MQSVFKKCKIILVTVLSSYLLAYAEDPRPFARVADVGEELLEEQALQRKFYTLEKPSEGIQCMDDAPAYSKEDAETYIHIESFEFTGDSLLGSEEQCSFVDLFLHKRTSFQELKNLVADITRCLMKKGCLTARAELLETDLQQGIVKINITDGFIERICFPSSRACTAFPCREGSPLRSKDLEQAMAQINRLPSESAVMSLWPGECVGGSWIQIQEHVSNPYRIHIGADNYGQRLTHEYRGKVVFEADNLFKINDLLQLTISANDRMQAAAAHLDVPYGYWNMGYDGSFSMYRYQLPYTKFSSQTTDGNSYNNAFYLKRVLLRTLSHTTHIKGELALRRPTRRINKKNNPVNNLTLLSVSLEHLWRSDCFSIFADVGYERGTHLFGADKDPKDLSKGAPHQVFNKVYAQLQYHQRLYKNLTFNSFFSTQYAWVGLPSTEQLTLTDYVNGVRGCSDLSLSSDRGVLLRNELSYAWQFSKLRLTPYGLFDWTYGQDVASKKKSITIASIGGGLRFAYSRLSGGIALAKIVHPSHLRGCRFQLKFNLLLKML